MNLYLLLADAVLLVHFLFILFALLGGALVAWHRAWLLAHLPAALWAVLLMIFNWHCPLTPLEKQLRLAGGEVGYEGGFIAQYLLPLVYPAGLTPTVQTLLGLFALGVNITVYTWVWRRRRG